MSLDCNAFYIWAFGEWWEKHRFFIPPSRSDFFEGSICLFLYLYWPPPCIAVFLRAFLFAVLDNPSRMLGRGFAFFLRLYMDFFFYSEFFESFLLVCVEDVSLGVLWIPSGFQF